jgi:hypothetical protein
MRNLFGITSLVYIAASASAQAPANTKQPIPLEAKTIELKHLKADEAVNLLKPYLVNGAGSVTWMAPNKPIITIKDVATNIPRMEQVLAKYDHSPATIRLVFQLIEADTGPRLSNAANSRALESDLDATLRSVLRFSGYRLVAQSVMTTGENGRVTQKLAPADSAGYFTYDIIANVGTIRLSDETLVSLGKVRTVSNGEMMVDTAATGSVQLNVALDKRAAKEAYGVISTGLDVPLGHTVVLGTAATEKGGHALILTVKPELVRGK